MQNIKELKKTNIPWMGEIPKHWEVRRLKNLYDFDKGQGLSKLDISNEGIHECLLYGELFTRFKGYNVIDDNFQKTNIQERKISKGNELLIPGSTTTTSVDLCNCKTLKKSGILLGGEIKNNDSLTTLGVFSFLQTIGSHFIIKINKKVNLTEARAKKSFPVLKERRPLIVNM